MAICEFCAREHDGSYGSGRFCNATCARQYSQLFLTDEARQRQKAPLIDPILRAEQFERRKINAEIRKQEKEKEKEERRKNRELEKEEKQRLKELENVNKQNKKKNYNKNSSSSLLIKNDPFFESKVRIKGKHNTDFHNYKQLGDIGEASAAKLFLEHGVDAYKPISENSKSDFIADIGGELKRIQVKTSTCRDYDDKVMSFNLTHGKLEIGHDSIKGKRIPYTKDEVDYFVLYNYIDDELYMIENEGDMRGKNIRLKSPENYYDKYGNSDNSKTIYASDCLMGDKIEQLKHGIKDIIELDENGYYNIEINVK